MAMWICKVNKAAEWYLLNEKQIVHYVPKFQGVAKRWYEGLPLVFFFWSEWQTKLLSAIPSEKNYGQMVAEMLARRARFNDSLEEYCGEVRVPRIFYSRYKYFYEKVTFLTVISGKRAVRCVLYGIDDRAVRLGAEAAQYEDLDKLIIYLKNTRNVKPIPDRKVTN
ncbi:unnamed protein product [Euphydryas editha]|uniref:Uncharacterized protein n=1 Tax=Euphydryas editha TaxID=104508 RepID=A0AAU9TKE1_EUPED|nr:unnamed protein product [Euphydryas editha]